MPRYYEHYVEFGSDEGRPCSGAPEITRYVTARGGVDWSPVYDGAYYRERNADVEAAYTEDFGSVELLDDSGMLAHFVGCGMSEGAGAPRTSISRATTTPTATCARHSAWTCPGTTSTTSSSGRMRGAPARARPRSRAT